MPCFDGRAEESENKTMRFCCETLSKMVEEGKPIPTYMEQWWADHQEWDAEHGRPHTKKTHLP